NGIHVDTSKIEATKNGKKDPRTVRDMVIYEIGRPNWIGRFVVTVMYHNHGLGCVFSTKRLGIGARYEDGYNYLILVVFCDLLEGLVDIEEGIGNTAKHAYDLPSSNGRTKPPVLWDEIGEGSLIRPELVQEMTDKVVVIKEKLKAARDRQKSYANNRCKPLEFEVGDRVMLKVSPWKGVVCFRKRGKLAPRYVVPFEILKRIGPIAYRLRLSEELSGVHDTFHVSNLKKCLADAILHVPLDEIKVDKTIRFVEEPVEIMDREIKSLKRSKISLVKVRWNSKRGLEFT
ncbi:hypothetical protein Tco_0164358, partial [Tanacetum coccineum]